MVDVGATVVGGGAVVAADGPGATIWKLARLGVPYASTPAAFRRTLMTT